MTKRNISAKQGGAGHVPPALLPCSRLMGESGNFLAQVNDCRDCFCRRWNERGDF